MALIRLKRSLLLASAVQTPQNGGHLHAVELFLHVLGVVGVVLVVLLGAVGVLLLDFEPFHVVLVHDLLDALVVVQDRQARHLVKVGKVVLKSVATSDELIPSVHQSLALELIVRSIALSSLLRILQCPVRTKTIIKGL